MGFTCSNPDAITQTASVPMSNTVPTSETVLTPEDVRRLELAVRRAESAASTCVSELLPVTAPAAGLPELVREHCDFAHRGVLLFPSTCDEAMRYFDAAGYAPSAPVPSVVVAGRVGARHGVAPRLCGIRVGRLHVAAGDARIPGVEVFLFPHTSPAWNPEIAAHEREFGFEEHTALHVRRPDEELLTALMTALHRDAGLIWEGGGVNPGEGETGNSVLYFVRGGPSTTGRERFERWELCCPGDFGTFIARHPVDRDAVERLYRDTASGRA